MQFKLSSFFLLTGLIALSACGDDGGNAGGNGNGQTDTQGTSCTSDAQCGAGSFCDLSSSSTASIPALPGIGATNLDPQCFEVCEQTCLLSGTDPATCQEDCTDLCSDGDSDPDPGQPGNGAGEPEPNPGNGAGDPEPNPGNGSGQPDPGNGSAQPAQGVCRASSNGSGGTSSTGGTSSAGGDSSSGGNQTGTGGSDSDPNDWSGACAVACSSQVSDSSCSEVFDNGLCVEHCKSVACASCVGASNACGADCESTCGASFAPPPDNSIPEPDCMLNSECGVGRECVGCGLTDDVGWCRVTSECSFDSDCGLNGKCGYNVESSDWRCLPAAYCEE